MRAIRQLANLFSAAIPATQPPSPPIVSALRAAPPTIRVPPPRVLAPALKSTPSSICAPPPRVHIIPPESPSPRVPVIVSAYPIRPSQDVLKDYLTQYLPCCSELSTAANEAPTLIKPDINGPVSHCYLLRNHRLPSRPLPRAIQIAFAGSSECDVLRDKATAVSEVEKKHDAPRQTKHGLRTIQLSPQHNAKRTRSNTYKVSSKQTSATWSSTKSRVTLLSTATSYTPQQKTYGSAH